MCRLGRCRIIRMAKGYLYRRLADFVEGRELGIVFDAPMDVLVQREPLRTRQPDIFYLNFERIGISGREELTGLPFVECPIDLAVEVLSPSNTARELQARLEDYNRIGILECWLVNPTAQTVEIINLTGEEPVPAAIFGAEDTLASGLLEGFTLELRELFR